MIATSADVVATAVSAILMSDEGARPLGTRRRKGRKRRDLVLPLLLGLHHSIIIVELLCGKKETGQETGKESC